MQHIRKRVLVTGGAGFLGSHLCQALVEKGDDVLCVDNYYTGQKKNIEDLLGRPNLELLWHDITFPLYVEVDEIYNMACPASPIHYQFDLVQTTKTSVHGAINMLGLQNEKRRKSFRHRPVKCMAIRRSTRNAKTIGGMSIRLASDPVMTKEKDVPKPSFLITTGSII